MILGKALKGIGFLSVRKSSIVNVDGVVELE